MTIPFHKWDKAKQLSRKLYQTKGLSITTPITIPTIIKVQKMQEKMNEYDCMILLDDDHEILKQTKVELQNRGYVYHISSALI